MAQTQQRTLALVGVVSLALLGACASRPPVSDGFCLLAEPIYWSAQDTDQTVLQVKQHNAVGVSECEWGK